MTSTSSMQGFCVDCWVSGTSCVFWTTLKVVVDLVQSGWMISNCTGNERNITECLTTDIGNHDCSHLEDIGLECTGE